MNVIFHIDEQEKWPLVPANVQNFANEMTSRAETFHILIFSEWAGSMLSRK